MFHLIRSTAALVGLCCAFSYGPASSQNLKIGWQKLPGKALDISVGHRGPVWAVGPDKRAYRFDGKKWLVIAGIDKLQNIDVAPDG